MKPSDLEEYVEEDLKNYVAEEPLKKSQVAQPVSKKIKRGNEGADSEKQAMPLTKEDIRAALLKMVKTRFIAAIFPKDMETKLDQKLAEDDVIRKEIGLQSTDTKFKKERAARDTKRAFAPKDTTIHGLVRICQATSHQLEPRTSQLRTGQLQGNRPHHPSDGISDAQVSTRSSRRST